MTDEIRNLLQLEVSKFKRRICELNPRFDFDSPSNDKYLCAVRFAYNDAKRALEGITNTDQRCYEKENALNRLAQVLQNYFESDREFDHKNICDLFMAQFNSYRITYGAAQKIVNLSFKYLYCFDDFRAQHYEKFQPCHMVLDSFILGWFKRNVDQRSIVHIRYNESWSGLRDYDRYDSIQRLIKSYVDDKKSGLSVLEYEFILWPNTMLYEAAINWLATISDEERSELYKKYPISELGSLISEIGTECSSFGALNSIDSLL